VDHVSLLTQIQDAATEANESVTVLLRKCKILAAKLDHPPFAEWVEWELNGYPSDDLDILPSYRRIGRTEARGNFSGGFGAYINNGLIPVECVDKDDRDALFSVNLTGSAAEYEALVAQSGEDGSKGALRSPWPSAAVIKYADRIWEMYACTEAWKIISPATLTAVIDAIRNRALSFALEIEREDPDAGEVPIGAAPIPRETLDRAYTINILGGSNVIAAGDISNVIQSLDLDWQGLKTALMDHGLPEAEIQNLAAALTADRRVLEQGQLGPATEGWIGKITTRIETGALDLTTNASGGVIAGLVLKALGIG
jgi:hypothetical protein